MEIQCAGCGTVFEDGKEPKGPNERGPRPYGCCSECNKHTFRSNEKPAEPDVTAQLDADSKNPVDAA